MKKIGSVTLVLGLVAIAFFSFFEVTKEVNVRQSFVDLNAKEDLKKQIVDVKRNITSLKDTPTYKVDGMDRFVSNYQDVFYLLEKEKVLFRFQVQRYFEKFINRINLSTNDVAGFNSEINQTVKIVLDQSQLINLPADKKKDFIEKVQKLRNPLFLSSRPENRLKLSTSLSHKLDDVSDGIEKLGSRRNLSFHVIDQKKFYILFAGVFVLSFGLGFLLRNNGRRDAASIVTQEARPVELSHEIRKVMNEMECPLVICDSSFEIVWENAASSMIGLDRETLRNKMARIDFSNQKAIEFNSKRFYLKTSELNYQSGKKHYFIQFSPALVVPQLTEHFSNPSEVEKALKDTLSTAQEFLSLNDVLLNTASAMNYYFKSSQKMVDIDLKKNMSETFVGQHHLSEIAKGFLHTAYLIIKDEPLVDGMYLRTDENESRLEISAFLPNMTQTNFDQHFELQNIIQRLTQIETKFYLYEPRVSFRWVDNGQIIGMDMRLTFANRNAMEALVNRAESTV